MQHEKEFLDTAYEGSARKAVSRRDFLKYVGATGAVIGVGGSLGGLITACGGGSATASGASMSTGATGSTETSVALTPKYGGTLRVATLALGANIGWPAALHGGSDMVQSYYETLLHSDEKGNLSPWLAESYKVAGDRKSIAFTIRKGVKFSDGSDLTADVIKWNLEQYATSQPSWASIEVVDPNTVRVNFKTWDSSLAASFGDVGDPALLMVSKVAYDKNGQEWMTTHPVGTGAFTLVSFVTDSTAKLAKNPNYWAKDKDGGKLPYLDGLEFTFTSDATTELMMAKAGEIDMVDGTTAGKGAVDYKNIGWRVNYEYNSNEAWVPDSAHADSPWSKLEVREAAEYAVDRATIAEKFGYGYLKAPNQIPPRNTTAYDSNYAGRKYDPAKAKELLTQAGYPNGFKTKLIVWPGGDRTIALAEQQYLVAVGIKAEIEFADAGGWGSYVGAQGKYHNAIIEVSVPSQGPTGLGCVKFIMSLFGNNWQKPAEFTTAYAAATSSLTADVSLVRATTDVLTKNALVIPLYEFGTGRTQQPHVVAEFGNRGLPTSSPLDTAWLNK